MAEHHHRQLSIIGCGYTGLALARLASSRGYAVQALTRSAERAAALAEHSIPAAAHDLDAPAPDLAAGLILSGGFIAYLVPPARGTPGDPRLARFLAGLAIKPRGLVYLSTSGVYGDCGGALVDEDRPPVPQTDRAKRRLAAERTVRAWCDRSGVAWGILRAPGIYGPGRLGLERLRRGEPLLALEDANPGNRIHVTDLAGVILASLEAGPPNRVFNVSDGDHASSTAFLLRLAEIVGLPAPPLVSREDARTRITARRRSFLAESRRLDNRRMLTELDVELKYPRFEAGIEGSLSETSGRD